MSPTLPKKNKELHYYVSDEEEREIKLAALNVGVKQSEFARKHLVPIARRINARAAERANAA